MANNPIQIVLNSSNFIDDWKKPKGGDNKDFYEGRDSEFIVHRQNVISQLESINEDVIRNEFAQIGFVKLILNPSAIAKSNRPVDYIFKKNIAPIVGAGDLGELFVEVNPSAIEELTRKIKSAEDTPKIVINKEGKEQPAPSGFRSEVGAIEEIKSYATSDKRNFSINQGIEWLSNPLTGGSYLIELFETPPPQKDWDTVSPQKSKLFESFESGLAKFGNGLVATNLSVNNSSQMFGIKLESSNEPPKIQISSIGTSNNNNEQVNPINLDLKKHDELISFLDRHPLVKKISLPPLITKSDESLLKDDEKEVVNIPAPEENREYPIIGIIDGGISPLLKQWVIVENEYISPLDRDNSHGTHIGGLLIMGNKINGTDVCKELDGCKIIDLGLLPKEGKFRDYYRNNPMNFFTKLNDTIGEIKSTIGARVFNFSLNTHEHVSTKGYSYSARMLDVIANEHDVIFIISAGNTENIDTRNEWPEDPTKALSLIATSQNYTIKSPAESCRNISVSALNPPNMQGIVPFAPTNYTCLGPGMRVGIKPDVGHIGGAGSKHNTKSGLKSIGNEGNIVHVRGTSFAAPIVAKTLACIDQKIEGYTSRETLMALLLHHTSIPKSLNDKKLKNILRNVVGFGVPSCSDEVLQGDDNTITLVFANRIKSSKRMQFKFSWPPSLVNNGSCRGNVRLTLVSTPPFDYKYGAEFTRININAFLRQQEVDEDGVVSYKGRLKPIYEYEKGHNKQDEKNLIQNSFKWASTKIFKGSFKGVGSSSEWTLDIEYLERNGVKIPDDGVPFTVILTISDNEKDPSKRAPIFTEMHQYLTSIGVKIADIQTASRITRRV